LAEFDLAAIYRTARERLLDLAPSLDRSDLATHVPTCPAWTVQDTYAHLAGLASDAVGGMTGWLGSPDNTARQVGVRSNHGITAICDEWRANGPDMDAHIASHRIGALAMDAWTHDQDIHNALGLVSGRTGPGLELTMSSVWRLKRTFREQEMPGLRIVTDDHDWLVADGEPGATLHIGAYELARAAIGRRSRAQMLSYQWQGEPEPYLTMLPVFTPPETDIVE
jgi:uncharacterized protein (TIGR03083 family)